MSDNNNSFANFMAKKSDASEPKSSSSFGTNKTQQALDDAKEKQKEEKAKELQDAKKNSVALANRYGKADMMKMQARNMIVMIPFILIGVLFFIILIFKGGDWLKYGINTLFNTMVGK